MKKSKIRIILSVISIILAIVIVFLCASCSCGNNEGDSSIVQSSKSIVLGGDRRYKAVETNEYFMKDGKSDYRIVIPVDAKEMETMAAEELVYFIKEATGVKINITSEISETAGESSLKMAYILHTGYLQRYAQR